MDILHVLDIGISIAGNHENVTSISNYVQSGRIQHLESSSKSGHYVTYIFSDPGFTFILNRRRNTIVRLLPVTVLMILNLISTFFLY